MGPTLKTNKQNIQGKLSNGNDRGQRERVTRFFFFFSFSLLSQIHGNLTVGFRRVKNESSLRDEGYAWIPKTQDFTGFPHEIVNMYEYV